MLGDSKDVRLRESLTQALANYKAKKPTRDVNEQPANTTQPDTTTNEAAPVESKTTSAATGDSIPKD
jgi:hypothetical protein